jgi:uncharacterized protein (TIGR02466 family)
MINVTKVPLFTESVSFFTMPDHENWKKQILNIIKVEDNKNIHKHSTVPDREDNIKATRTAWDSHLRYPTIGKLTNKIIEIIHTSVREDGYDAPLLKIEDSWINWYRKDQFAVPHFHACHMSVVYFVDTEESSSHFIFTQKDHYRLQKKEGDKTITNTHKQMNIKDGTVIFFNGDMWHSVSPNLTDKLRVTFATNLCPKYVDDWDDRKNYAL